MCIRYKKTRIITVNSSMNPSILAVALLLLTPPVLSQPDPDWLYNGASTLMRHFHSRFGHQMCQYGIHTESNVVFSAFRIFESLATIYSAASDSVRDELNLHLGIYGERRELMCHTMERMRQLIPCLDDTHFGAMFDHVMFHQSGLHPNETIIDNQCFNGQLKPVDFTDPEESLNGINEWHEELSPSHYRQYLDIPPNKTDQLFFTNGISFCFSRMAPYISDGYMNMIDINGNTRQVKAMKKYGKMYVLKDPKSNVTIIREDLLGGAYYSVIVTQDNFEPNDHVKFMNMFGGGILSELLLRVLKVTSAKLMEVRMPEIKMETRLDLKEILTLIASESMFKHGALLKLFNIETNLECFPYFEALNITGKHSSTENPINGAVMTAITNPFLFLILDRQYSRPLITVSHLGFN